MNIPKFNDEVVDSILRLGKKHKISYCSHESDTEGPIKEAAIYLMYLIAGMDGEDEARCITSFSILRAKEAIGMIKAEKKSKTKRKKPRAKAKSRRRK